MSRKNIFANAFMGIFSQAVLILSQFIIRTFFIHYIGSEMLGLDGALLSILNIVSLAEAGFSSAIIVFLVKPMKDEDWNTVNKIVNTLRVVYKIIGIGYFTVAMLLVPFLRFFLTKIEINNWLYVFYTILVINGSLTYFFSYRKTLLIADQKMYICQFIQSVSNIVFGILQIIAIILFKNYAVYLSVKLMETFFSNLTLYVFTNRKYKYLKKSKYDKAVLNEVLPATRNLFAGQIAGYVYASSDALMISKFISTIMVTFYSNYFMVANGLKTLLLSLFMATTPMLKNMMVSSDNREGESYEIFQKYSTVCAVLVVIVIVPAHMLIQPFITMWVGNEFILSRWIFDLMLLDVFICVMQNPMGGFILASELFKWSKYADMIGATINIIISVAMVSRFGLMGVMLGTVISRMIQWFVRFYATFRFCFNKKGKEWFKYWNSIFLLLIVILLLSTFSDRMFDFIQIENFILKFIVCGLVSCVASFSVIISILFFKDKKKQ